MIFFAAFIIVQNLNKGTVSDALILFNRGEILRSYMQNDNEEVSEMKVDMHITIGFKLNPYV